VGPLRPRGLGRFRTPDFHSGNRRFESGRGHLGGFMKVGDRVYWESHGGKTAKIKTGVIVAEYTHEKAGWGNWRQVNGYLRDIRTQIAAACGKEKMPKLMVDPWYAAERKGWLVLSDEYKLYFPALKRLELE
jgi:hypothetical protein